MLNTVIRGFAALGFAIAMTSSPLGTTLAAETAISGDHIPTSAGDLIIHPLKHATMVLAWNGKTIFVDPAPAPGAAKGVDGAAAFQGLGTPDFIIITHVHPDHFDVPTLEKVAAPATVIVVPQSIADQLPASLKSKARVLANGASTHIAGIEIEAVPAYNTTADRMQYHPKGRDDGYVLTFGGKRVYVAGDTEGTPEMLALKNIDVAFIPMNLPYTMTPEEAAKAVLTFKPKIVYPYHYGQSDLAAFTKAIGTNSGIDVRLRNWY